MDLGRKNTTADFIMVQSVQIKYEVMLATMLATKLGLTKIKAKNVYAKLS